MIKEKEIPNLFKFSVLILGSGNFIQPLPLPSPLFSLPHGIKDVNKYHEGKREHVYVFKIYSHTVRSERVCIIKQQQPFFQS
jgi:hypothetical protein